MAAAAVAEAAVAEAAMSGVAVAEAAMSGVAVSGVAVSDVPVTVVVAAYEPGPLLRAALASVLSQTRTDWRLVVVDDGSSEDLSWVRDLDDRVELLRQPNQGVSVARNVGTRASTSPYVAFLDQDDVWRPTKLARQLDVIDDSAFCCTGFDLIDGDGRLTGPGYGRPVSYLDMLRGELGLLLSSLLVRRDDLLALGGFSPALRMQQDLDVFLRLARHQRGAFVDSAEVSYRRHPGNASRDHRTALSELLALYGREADRGPAEAEAVRTGRRRAARTYAFQAVDAARAARAQPLTAAAELAWALRLSPTAVASSAGAWVRRRGR